MVLRLVAPHETYRFQMKRRTSWPGLHGAVHRSRFTNLAIPVQRQCRIGMNQGEEAASGKIRPRVGGRIVPGLLIHGSLPVVLKIKSSSGVHFSVPLELWRRKSCRQRFGLGSPFWTF
jgi:hypothetical protein